MRHTIRHGAIELVQGDISLQQVDAIVNAANAQLAGGSGVDGAIHRRGGPAIMEETDRRYPQGCPTGSAVISGAGQLPCKFVIHAVGPMWSGGNFREPEALAGAYRKSLELAAENQCESVAFPAISTGVYRYPMDLACRTALATAQEFFEKQTSVKLVRFVLFGAGPYGAFSAALEELVSSSRK